MSATPHYDISNTIINIYTTIKRNNLYKLSQNYDIIQHKTPTIVLLITPITATQNTKHHKYYNNTII